MFDCDTLEYKICEILKNSNNEQAKGFWCDGVLLSGNEQHYSKKFVNDNRYVNLKTFIGKDGQTEYLLILKFGKEALSRYARGLSINECLFSICALDTVKKIIEIQLR